jgi:hypothetical protein
MKQTIILLIACFCLFFQRLQAQNSARIFSAGGEVFHVTVNGKQINKLPEANVLIENIANDTLLVLIQLENNTNFEANIFLLDQGKKTHNQEYNYKLVCEKDNNKVLFAGIKEPTHLADPLVPEHKKGHK